MKLFSGAWIASNDGTTNGRTVGSPPLSPLVPSLMIMLLLADVPISEAWRCSRCSRSTSGGATGPPFLGNPSTSCQDCLDNGEEECEDYVSYIGRPSLPYHDMCEWKQLTGQPLDDSFSDSFEDCSDWDAYGDFVNMDIIEQEINAQYEDSCFYMPDVQFKCYRCDDECTRVYTCGDTSYACNHLFDMTMIQFNAQPDTPCRSLLPLKEEHMFEYCGQEDIQSFTIDCGGLCDLDEATADEVLQDYICPNGEPIDSYWTVCSDQNLGGYAEIIGLDFGGAIGAVLSEAEDILGFSLDQFWHFSCVDLGEVTCAFTEVERSPKKGKKKKLGKKGKNGGTGKGSGPKGGGPKMESGM